MVKRLAIASSNPESLVRIYLLLDCGQFFAFLDAASAKQLTHAVAAAFECLRLANLFGMPSEATIQALLMN